MIEAWRTWAERAGRAWNEQRDRITLESLAGETRVSPEASLQRHARDEAELETALDTLERLSQGAALEERHLASIEAIIEPETRPVLDLFDGAYGDVPESWAILREADVRARIAHLAPSIGRVDVLGHPRIDYAGTAFLVSTTLMMTNRHVAEVFAEGIGLHGLAFRPGLGSAVDLKQEVAATPPVRQLVVERVVMIHPYWDCALLQVSGLDALCRPLTLAAREPVGLPGKPVVVIGYPALDPRGDIAMQMRIFRVFEKKRLQPGTIVGYGEVASYRDTVTALTHDVSTLGGNSGSALIDLDTGEVIGLHFAGRHRVANYAVPVWELARDPRVVDAGVDFAAPVGPTGPPPWEHAWQELAR